MLPTLAGLLLLLPRLLTAALLAATTLAPLARLLSLLTALAAFTTLLSWMAVTLVRGALAPDDFTDELVNDHTVQGLIHRTRHTPGAGELVVTLCDDTRLVEDLAPASNLLTPGEINTKFHQCTDDILSPVSPDAVIGMVERLETLALVRQLT